MEEYMIKKIEALERAISVVLFVVILFAILWQVISRKVLGSPSLWSDEFSRLLFVYMAVIGCHLAQRENIHVRIDAILNMMNEKGRLIVEFSINLVMTLIFFLIGFYGWKIVASTGVNDRLVTLNLSVGVLNSALVLLSVLMAVEMIAQMVNIIRNKKVVRE